MDFVVVDTEGGELLTEIAIIDSSGELIVEEFIDGNLEEVLKRIKPILEGHKVVAHSATHDRTIIIKSYASIGIEISIQTICTYQKSKKLLPWLSPHSLSVLSTNLLLKDSRSFFDESFAHRASYDARYTYLLYQKLLSVESSLQIAKKINPFSSSKVDNPFQKHFDDMDLYRDEFANLLSIVDEIKMDENTQSKTALVIGEAGNGKTHLMMRFLKNVSNTNRFLFVGKPNDKNSILFHTYTKILESFIQKIDDSAYSQLEYLLAKSFSSIIINLSTKSSKVIETLKENHLNIYEKFGRDGTEVRSRNWRSLEKVMLKWYRESYGNDTVSINILKALIKYTFYKDENRRDTVINYLSGKDLDVDELSKVGLEPWSEIRLEDFSLKAISLFGKLSIFDEPLIISFDQLEAMSSDEELLLSFGDSIKELITTTPNSLVILNLFPNRWREYEALFDGSFVELVGKNKIILERPDASSLKTMLKQRARYYDIDLDAIYRDKLIYKDILQYNSIRGVLNRASDYFKLYTHNIPLPKEMKLSLEDRVKELMARVEHLESLHKIENKSPSTKIDFNIDRYIRKIHSQKLKEYDRKTIIDDKQDIDKLKYILDSIDELYNFEIDFFKIKKYYQSISS